MGRRHQRETDLRNISKLYYKTLKVQGLKWKRNIKKTKTGNHGSATPRDKLSRAEHPEKVSEAPARNTCRAQSAPRLTFAGSALQLVISSIYAPANKHHTLPRPPMRSACQGLAASAFPRHGACTYQSCIIVLLEKKKAASLCYSEKKSCLMLSGNNSTTLTTLVPIPWQLSNCGMATLESKKERQNISKWDLVAKLTIRRYRWKQIVNRPSGLLVCKSFFFS